MCRRWRLCHRPRFGYELLEDSRSPSFPFSEAVIRQLNDPPAMSKSDRHQNSWRTRLYLASGTQQLGTKWRLLLREVSTGEQF